MISIRHLVAVSLTALFCSVSSASVNYSFSGFFGANLPEGWQDATATFSITLPDVISSDLTVPVESMISCSVPFGSCRQVKFVVSSFNAGWTTPLDTPALLLSSESAGVFYYFSSNAFATFGENANLANVGSPAKLTISSVVPEPGTLATMLLGLCGLVLRAPLRGKAKRAISASRA
ncbi:PEP-CTERM sorting domain-containing protein [Roseateles paludis]|jgi:hypothetical protein|uniref:PEP-CTERM sorting domain-containing protein n=1 Tax=Roseateles paludis TaxID=3145238 RepID=A0ABV0G317_9BURK